jgi:hypothetical protein
MDVRVEMTVQMRRCQAESKAAFDLAAHPILHLASGRGIGQEAQAPKRWIPLAKHEVDPDAEAGQGQGLLSGLGRCRSVDHEAGKAQHPLAVGQDYGFVDLGAGAEVVGGGNELTRDHWGGVAAMLKTQPLAPAVM